MKKVPVIAAVFLAVSAMSSAAQKPQTFTGEITDRDCVEMAGHEMMMKKGETPKDCTIACVRLGSKYVLYDAETKVVYQLDDQKKPEQYAGSKVKVTGTYDAATKTIHVTDVQLAS